MDSLTLSEKQFGIESKYNNGFKNINKLLLLVLFPFFDVGSGTFDGTVEVFFKESKQYLGLGKCQSQDFDAQVANATICMIQYNLLSVAKRFTYYESLGELFRNTTAETIQLTVSGIAIIH